MPASTDRIALARLLAPKSIAFIGGAEAEVALEGTLSLGFPGKMGMSGAAVWDEYCAGNLKGIRDYCETDVLNTWLVYLRFEHLRGTLGETALAAEFARVREFLQTSDAAHLQAFLAAWDAAGAA